MALDEAPAVGDQRDPSTEDGQLGLFKEYLSEPRFRIKLDDQVNTAVRAALVQTSNERFPINAGRVTGEDFAARLRAYEEAVRPLQSKAVLLGKWATPEQHSTLGNMLARMSDNCGDTGGGNTLWLGLRWYPLSLLMYSAGLGALSVENYFAFAAIHTRRIDARDRRGGTSSVEMIVPVVDAMLDVLQTDAWKCLPEYKQKHTPESEYLFKTLQPALQDLLFLGGGYDQLFDRYEILRALMYADLTDGTWGPIGRFGWKHTSRMSDGSPYKAILAEADQKRGRWGPIAAGLFRGSYEQFLQVATRFEKERMSKLNFF